MPDFPRPAVAFPAYQTPSGLTAQAVREHHSDYAETQGQAQELTRRTNGVWVPLPYSSGRFTADTPAIWAVLKREVIEARYKVVGAQFTLMFNITGALLIAGAAWIAIEMPERLRARNVSDALLWGAVAGVPTSVLAQCVPGSRRIAFYRFDFAPWPPGGLQVAGNLVVEVEET